jgi:hypothetical protein
MRIYDFIQFFGKLPQASSVPKCQQTEKHYAQVMSRPRPWLIYMFLQDLSLFPHGLQDREYDTYFLKGIKTEYITNLPVPGSKLFV